MPLVAIAVAMPMFLDLSSMIPTDCPIRQCDQQAGALQVTKVEGCTQSVRLDAIWEETRTSALHVPFEATSLFSRNSQALKFFFAALFPHLKSHRKFTSAQHRF
ncbi:hypothetical protein L1987_11732 [Smallanthus sonchifolius]|uniref:Uncharacterized protein n=1 Tax=Smallanthus sonchifolius TaxID=185202 RepID=A0ACB9JF82_9ASTR|nr:hypothetical protein L1987_11732 [Smallanthus sonchifolius]